MSRSPSFFERYYILRGTNGFYSNFNISAKYSRNVLKVNLSNALKNLISENQCFAVNFFRENANDVERDGANFRLRPLDKIHFNDVVSVRELPWESSTKQL